MNGRMDDDAGANLFEAASASNLTELGVMLG